VITAEGAGYKRRSRGSVALETIGVRRERVLHIAQLFHDHVPAAQLGLTSVWIDRRHDRPGAGATPPAGVAGRHLPEPAGVRRRRQRDAAA
jgi:FMN phosphatase YigB (HAD superfamily)